MCVELVNMTRRSSTRRSMNRTLLLAMLLLWANQAAIGHQVVAPNSRSFLWTKLRDSPVGLGVQSALQEKFGSDLGQRPIQIHSYNQHHHHQYRRRNVPTRQSNSQSHSQQEQKLEQICRTAAIHFGEMESLRETTTPHLKTQRNRNRSSRGTTNQEMDWSQEDDTVLCSSTSKASRKTETTTTKRIQVIKKEMNSDDNSSLNRPLSFLENMICGAVSRSVAQTAMHPANTMKTILQSSQGVNRPTFFQLMHPTNFRMLTRGAGANFILSVPHGALNFAVLEYVRDKLNQGAEAVPFLKERLDSIGPALDFASSAISTICCSLISTPQMMLTDNIMAGNYNDLTSAARGLYAQGGVMGLYSGWWPGLVGKIPSYVRIKLGWCAGALQLLMQV